MMESSTTSGGGSVHDPQCYKRGGSCGCGGGCCGKYDCTPAPEPMMADGKTRLSDYLENALSDGECSNEWTKGYEECKRRLFKVVGAQLRAAPAQATFATYSALSGATRQASQEIKAVRDSLATSKTTSKQKKLTKVLDTKL